jgi:hypothetical protein
VINTLDPSFFPVNIRKLLKERKDLHAEKHKTFVDIKSDIYNLIINSQLVSRSKDWYDDPTNHVI